MKSSLATVTVVLLLTSFAWAGDPELAERLFTEAIELADAGEHDVACEKFAASMQADPSGGTALNLARCADMKGLTASSWRHTLHAMKLFAESGEEERERFARQKAAELEATLSTLKIVAPNESGLVVRLDGEAVSAAELGAAVPVDPGEHTIEAVGPTRPPWSKRVQVHGEAHAAVVEIPPSESAVNPAHPTAGFPSADPVAVRERGPGPVLIAGGVLLGTGAAVAIVGAALGAVVLSETDDAEERCPNRQCPTDPDYQSLEPIKDKAMASNVLLGVGGGLAAIGAVMLIVEAAGAGEAEVVLAPSVGRTGSGLMAIGRF